MEPDFDASVESLDSPADSDNLEQALDEALAEDKTQLPEYLGDDILHVEPTVLDTAAFHKAAPAQRSIFVGPTSEPDHAAQSGMPLNEVAFDMWIRQKRSSSLQLPWERNTAAKIFGYKDRKLLQLPQIGCNSALSSSTSSASREPPDSLPGSEFAKKRLRVSAMIRSDDQVRWEALRKFKVLLTINPANSFLGSTLADKATLLRGENEISASFCDAFADKKTGTLSKRASSCWRFIQWVIKQGFDDPLSVGEAVFYSYMGHLRETGAPTTADCFLQSWTFLFHVAGLKTPPLGMVLSPRVRGAAKDMFGAKRKLVQAEPLTVKMVYGLERVALSAPYDHWKVIAGHLLFCLGASSRFADSVHLDSLIISSDPKSGLTLVEADSAKYKTGNSNERRTRLLPLSSLGKFFATESWAEEWIRMRVKFNLPSSPSLPAWSEVSSCWLQRPMSTGEAALYLKEFLIGSGFDAQDILKLGCHSLKCTILSWLAKGSYASLADRRIAGHHMDPGSVSAITYSRDELTRIMAIEQRMVKDIRRKTFQPDQSRVQRLADLVATDSNLDNHPHIMEESDSGSEDLNESDLVRDELPNQARMSFDDLTLQSLVHARTHCNSGVCHLLLDDSKFRCGRKLTKNYDSITAGTTISDVPICMQCSRSFDEEVRAR